MIEIKQLRVGNFAYLTVASSQETAPVIMPSRPSKITTEHLRLLDRHGVKVDGAKLSPEALRRYGFTSTQFPNSLTKQLPNGKLVNVVFFANNLSLTISDTLQNFYPAVLYLHQLQNIVYDLTGFEITD